MNNESEQLFRLRICLCFDLPTKQELYLLALLYTRKNILIALLIGDFRNLRSTLQKCQAL